jgi:hypothetical protein
MLNRDVIQIIQSFLHNRKAKINKLIKQFQIRGQIKGMLRDSTPHPSLKVRKEWQRIENIFMLLYIMVDPASVEAGSCSKISPVYWYRFRLAAEARLGAF